jgi:F-type H+-transporting ATPase subunit b
MKLKAAIATILGVGLYPALAFCAEAGESQGSWLALMFFVINFAAFVYIIVYFAGPFVKNFFRARSSSIRETLGRLEKEVRQAQEFADEAQARAARLEADKSALATEMRAETAREIAHMRDLAHAAAERIKRDAELTAAAVADNAKRQTRAHLAQVATDLARKLIASNLDASDQSRLIDDFMQRLHQEVAKP